MLSRSPSRFLLAAALLLGWLSAPRTAWCDLKLCMKDGSYQIVSSYEIRIRYSLAHRFSTLNRAAAVMLGGASEKAALLLIDSYANSIADATKKQRFESEVLKAQSIFRKYDLNAFVNDVRLLINRHALGTSGGQSLIDVAESIIAALRA
jgi:hypothetical protein